MADGTSITATGGEVDGKALTGDLTLALITSTNVALTAGNDIIDGNAALLNVDAVALSLRAGGLIGNHDNANGTPTVNVNAIDTQVTTLAATAVDGIYICEMDALVIDTVAAVTVNVDMTQQVNFNSTVSAIPESRTTDALEDLTTTNNGPIKVVAKAGSLTISGGSDTIGVTASGTGDILLEARGSASDVIVNAQVSSGSGHITLNAGDDVDLNASLSTSGAGTVFFTAANGTDGDVVGPEVDGINVDGTITTVDGDVLLSSAQDIRLTMSVTSTTGDVGLIAARDILHTATGDITTGGDVLVQAGRDWTMANGTDVTATGGEVTGTAIAGDLTLGLITSTNVALTAGGDIIDANASSLNVAAMTLSLVAGGLIGNHDNLNGVPADNVNAIDTDVDTLAALAAEGIYICETNALVVDTVGAVTVNVDMPEQVNFNSTTTLVAETRTTDSLEDLTTTNNGPIKVVTKAGSLTINGGSDAIGVTAHGTGDILLEARGAGSDVILNTDVQSGTGHITLLAADSITAADDIRTAGSGTVFLNALAGSITLADADLDLTGISTVDGDVLLTAATDITLNANIDVSGDGDIGVTSGNDILQNADILTSTGDILITATRDVTMLATAAPATTTTSTGDGNILIEAGRTISLGLVDASTTGTVALAGGLHILDANAAFDAISGTDRVNVRAASLRMVADSDANNTGRIGDADLLNGDATRNVNAIDTEVDVLAALSAEGIYVQEAISGGDITIDNVAAVTVTVDVEQVNFNSTTTPVQATDTLATLDDLTTTLNGPIKLVALAGTIIVNDGLDADGLGIDANGTGDILLEARTAGSDVILNTDVQSGTGHITILAADSITAADDVRTAGTGSVFLNAVTGSIMLNDADLDGTGISTANGDVLLTSAIDITLNANVEVSGNGDIGVIAGNDVLQNEDITTATGDVLISATRDVTMLATADPAPVTTTSTGNGNVIISAGRTISLGLVSASGATGTISLDAGLDILDTNAAFDALTANDRTNLRATNVRMVADSDSNGTGRIGDADILNGDATRNANAIDTEVAVIAAQSAEGVHVREATAGTNITVDFVVAVTVNVDVEQVRFNSTTTAVSATDTLSELADLTTTLNGPIKVIAENGTITVNEGGDGDGIGIDANGTGDVLLEARGAGSDVVLNTDVQSGTGHITLIAADNITAADDIRTAGSGTVFLNALAGSITLADADLDLTGISTVDGDVLLTAATDITLNANIDVSGDGDIGVTSGNDILQNADILTATGDILLTATRDITMLGTTQTQAGGDVLLQATGTVRLAEITAANVAIEAGADVVDNNGVGPNVAATTLSLRAGGTIGAGDIGTIDPITAVTTAAANPGAIDTAVDVLAAESVNGIYINEVDDITIGNVAELTVAVNARQVNFNSTTSPAGDSVTIAELDDLTTTGTNRQIVLHAGGTVRITDGSDGDGIGVMANEASDVEIIADADLAILADVLAVGTVVDSSSATDGESINLVSKTGNITIGDGITISTDENLTQSFDVTSDRLSITTEAPLEVDSMGDEVPNSATGRVIFEGTVTVSTDGGVAHQFARRPFPGVGGTAFFIYTADPINIGFPGAGIDNKRIVLPGSSTTDPFFLNSFFVVIGVAGEQNLRLDIDWFDRIDGEGILSASFEGIVFNNTPTGDVNDVTSNRYQTFYVDEGGFLGGGQGYQIAHVYSNAEMTEFRNAALRGITVTFSVSQHDSIEVRGGQVTQSVTESVPGRRISSTDDLDTGEDPFLSQSSASADNPILELENGRVLFRIPVTPPTGLFTPPPELVVTPAPIVALEAPVTIIPPITFVEEQAGSVSSTAGSDVYYQFIREFPDGSTTTLKDHVSDSEFEGVDALEKLIEGNPEFQDGTGYKVLLIIDTGGQKIKRPVIEFEIIGGLPGVLSDTLPDDLDDLKLDVQEDFQLVPETPDHINSGGADDAADGDMSQIDPTRIEHDDKAAVVSERGPVDQDSVPVTFGEDSRIAPAIPSADTEQTSATNESVTAAEVAAGTAGIAFLTSRRLARLRQGQRELETPGLSRVARRLRRISWNDAPLNSGAGTADEDALQHCDSTTSRQT
ncbi:MAG: hypothetical protein R3C19_10910 [Planctomycetaceae bacterium]